jgi:hypothetical protein
MRNPVDLIAASPGVFSCQRARGYDGFWRQSTATDGTPAVDQRIAGGQPQRGQAGLQLHRIGWLGQFEREPGGGAILV